MTIHNLYMFDRHGVLMYYGEWNRKRQSGMTIEEVSSSLTNLHLNPNYYYCFFFLYAGS